MKLTRLQRYTAYCILLEEAERPEQDWVCDLGLCNLFQEVFGSWDLYGYEGRVLPEYFDKFYKQRPTSWRQRIAILKECIKELEEKLF